MPRSALLDAGAYGEVMASRYNARPRLVEVVHSAGELQIAVAPGIPNFDPRGEAEPLT